MIDLKEYAKEEFGIVTIFIINMVQYFLVALAFTFLIWLFRLILGFAGLDKSITFIIATNFTELEGLCFLVVFISIIYTVSEDIIR